LAIADELRQLIPNVSFVIPVAPSQTPKSLASFAQPKTNRDMALVYGTSAVLEQTNVGAQFVTPFGTVVKLWTAFPAYSVLANCDLCITTVGANTAELARLGVPMLVLLPLNKLDAMRAWDGLLGVMVRLPGIGTPLATVINWFASRWVGLLAWPNIWAKREIVPELRGHLKPAHVAQQARDLLVDALKRHHMREQLRQLTGQTGAAHAVAKIVANQLAKAKPRSQRPSR
jgi:lipid-A-disaccharide synthase